MSLPDNGTYLITNVKYHTVATIDSSTGDVHGGYNSNAEKQKWTVKKVNASTCTLQNVGFTDTYAGCKNTPTDGSNVVGSPINRHWVLKVVDDKIAISSLDAPDLYWGLTGGSENVVFRTSESANEDQQIVSDQYMYCQSLVNCSLPSPSLVYRSV